MVETPRQLTGGPAPGTAVHAAALAVSAKGRFTALDATPLCLSTKHATGNTDTEIKGPLPQHHDAPRHAKSLTGIASFAANVVPEYHSPNYVIEHISICS
ncbi:MAG TPA: hypothetical protein VGN55_20410 [Xanthobacteraceae bacterium]|jgi:hypothetical protein